MGGVIAQYIQWVELLRNTFSGGSYCAIYSVVGAHCVHSVYRCIYIGECICGVMLPRSLPDTLQLLFQVHGEVSSAMVSLAVRSHALWGRGLVYESLAVDFPHGERLVLKGSGTDSIFQGYTRLQQ